MESIILKSKMHCTDLLTKSRCQFLPFHDVQHTLEVFDNVKLIGRMQHINIDGLEPVLLAALFHDTGVSKTYKGHEEVSCVNAIQFLTLHKYPKHKIDIVTGCIKATQMLQKPTTEYEAILCDADLFHLSGKHFRTKNTLLRKEWETHLNLKFSNQEWYLLNLDFLKQHQYPTSFGKIVLSELKQHNLSLFTKYHEVSC